MDILRQVRRIHKIGEETTLVGGERGAKFRVSLRCGHYRDVHMSTNDDGTPKDPPKIMECPFCGNSKTRRYPRRR